MLEYTVKLGIYSESYSAEQISDLLGMKYDKYWVKGMPRSPRSEVIKFEEHAWFLVADPTGRELVVNDQIEALLKRIQPVVDKVKKIGAECGIVFNCQIIGNENPELSFTTEVIHGMSEIHASLDIDLFIAD